MKSLPVLLLAVFVAVPAWPLSRLEAGDIAELHWLPATASEARLRTRAAALWLADPAAEAQRWREQIELRLLALAGQAERDQPAGGAIIDGMLGWLVLARIQPLDAAPGGQLLRETLLQGLKMPVAQEVLQAGRVWAEVEERLGAVEGLDPALEIAAFWTGLHALAEQADPQAREFARAQAMLASDVAGGIERGDHDWLTGLAAMARVSSAASWQGGRDLPALWRLLDALAIQAAVGEDEELDALSDLIEVMSGSESQRLRRIDGRLPVVLAQLQDAATYLAERPPALDAAVIELTDAYFQLGLLLPDAAFYLTQPVREHLVEAIADCLPSPDLVGPLPREVFEQCPQQLFGLLGDGLESEELVGGSGPIAPEFLRREAGLLSWQRARFLDGYLNGQLQADCEPPTRANPLEWSILVQALASWVPQRPVFLDTQRWQGEIAALIERIEDQEAARVAWLDCLTGQGGERLDPVSRLLLQHDRALAGLKIALATAYQAFVDEHTRPGSDIDLSAAPDQLTGYRPEGLVVRPCSAGSTCGARVALPVSRALLGLFPNTYLLADQLAIGRLGLCYDEVRWEDREMRPARPGDDQVANYYGRLVFELVGTFDDGSGEQTVFRQRLKAAEPRHYLFAAASDEVLASSCPDGRAGQPVPSRLPEDRLGLVPDRLTYFAATPVTANALLLANWDQGAEWRDWFVTADRVEVLEQARPAMLQARVQAELEALAGRRERTIAARLLGAAEDDPLARAMASVADNQVLLRRVLEIHYPRLLRHDPTIRSALTGGNGLVGQERVQSMREGGWSLAALADEGQASLAEFQQLWQSLSYRLREQGQPSPEAGHALRLLERLRSVSPSEPDAGESSPAP